VAWRSFKQQSSKLKLKIMFSNSYTVFA